MSDEIKRDEVSEPGSGRRPEGEGISRRRLVGTGIAAVGAAVVWGSPLPFSRKGIGQTIESAHAGTTGNPGGPHNTPSPERTPGRVGYCSVAGNTWPDGTPIPPGTFLNLENGQPDTDPYYKGAMPANFIDGLGATCDPPPAGFVRDGFADGPNVPSGFYPFFHKP